MSIYFDILETKITTEILLDKLNASKKELNDIIHKMEPHTKVACFEAPDTSISNESDIEVLRKIGLLKLRIDNLQKRYEASASAYKKQKDAVRRLNLIASNLEMKVFELHYIQGLSLRSIAKRLIYDEDHIYRINKSLKVKILEAEVEAETDGEVLEKISKDVGFLSDKMC